MHVPLSDKSHNTLLTDGLECLKKYYTALVYGMVESQTLSQLLLYVLKEAPSGFEEVPFPSCVDIHFPDSLMCSSLCNKPKGLLVFVWLIL
jgi:hypothetical protein